MEEGKKKLTIEELKKESYKLTDKILSDLKDCFNNDYTVTQACLEVGISQDTYYQWIGKSEEFKALMERHQNDLKIKARKILARKVAEGDEDMAKWFLERRDKKLYSPRTEVTGDEGGPVQTANTVTFVDGA